MAKMVAHVGADGKIRTERVGEWIPYNANNVHIAASTTVAHDTYEGLPDINGVLVPGENPAYGTDCGLAGSRYWFGAGYLPGWRYNDMPYTAASQGQMADRCAYSFSCALDSFNDFQMQVFTTENFPQTASDPNSGANDPVARGDYPGIAFSYGALANGGGFYYFSDIDLTGSGLAFQMPNGGQGGLLTLMGDVDTVNNTITLVGQHMLWGIKELNPTPQQLAVQWDDDNPADLVFSDDPIIGSELYDYAYALCPDPLSISFGFYYTATSTSETLVPTGFSVGTSKLQSGNLASLAADDNNPLVVCKFLVPNATDIIKVSFDFKTTKANITAIDLITKAKMVQGGVFKLRPFMHNYATNVDDIIAADTAITAVYAVFTFPVSGTLNNYKDASSNMNAKILVRQLGPSVAVIPCVSYEYVNLKVTG